MSSSWFVKSSSSCSYFIELMRPILWDLTSGSSTTGALEALSIGEVGGGGHRGCRIAQQETIERLEINYWGWSRSEYQGHKLSREPEFAPLLQFVRLEYLSIEDERFVRFEHLPPNLRTLVIKHCNLYRNKGRIYPGLRKLRQYCSSIQKTTVEYDCGDVLARAEAGQINEDDTNPEMLEGLRDIVNP